MLGLAEAGIGIANTVSMIEIMQIKAKIQNYIDEHQSQVDLVKSLKLLIDTTFQQTLLKNQIKDLSIVSASIFSQISQNMLLLKDVADEILDKYGNIKSNLSNSTKDYLMVSVIGVMSISQAVTSFIDLAKQAKPYMNIRKQLSSFIRRNIMRPRDRVVGVVQENEDIALTTQETNTGQGYDIITQEQSSEALEGEYDVITMDQVQGFQRGGGANKPSKFKKYGKAAFKLLTTGFRLLMIYVGIISFNESEKNLEQLRASYKKYQDMFKPGGEFQSDQLAVLRVITLMCTNAVNILYDAYNTIFDLRNIFHLLSLSVPQLHDYFTQKYDNLDPKKFLKGFNYAYIQYVSTKTKDIFTVYQRIQRDYNSLKTNNKEQARNKLQEATNQIQKHLRLLQTPDLHQFTEFMKKRKIQFTDKQPTKYSKMVNDIGEKLQDNSVGLTLNLKNLANKFSGYAQVMVVTLGYFNSRKDSIQQVNNNQNDLKEKNRQLRDIDSSVLRSISSTFIQKLINQGVDKDKRLDFAFISQTQFLKELPKIEERDSQFKNNIGGLVAAFTDKFYYDDPSGNSLFKRPLNAYIKPQVEFYRDEQRQFYGIIPDIILIQEDIVLDGMNLDDLNKNFQKNYPEFQLKIQIQQKRRCKFMKYIKQTVEVLNYNEEKKTVEMSNKDISHYIFQEGMIIKCVEKGQKKQEIDVTKETPDQRKKRKLTQFLSCLFFKYYLKTEDDSNKWTLEQFKFEIKKSQKGENKQKQ